MKPGRNEPCPCGSGKKYKKCCYLKEASSTEVESEYLHDDEPNEIEKLLYNALYNFRKFALDKKPHIKEYYKIRKMHSEIVDAMIRYHEDGKFVPAPVDSDSIKTKASAEVQLIETSFDVTTRIGGQALYDILIYKPFSNMTCITEEFINKHRYRKLEKIEFLHSMLNSKRGLFEVTGADSDEGYVYMRDVFTGEEHTVVDISLSGEKNYSDYYLYTRIITYNGISFNSGLNLVFVKSDTFIKDFIKQNKKDYNPNGDFMRFTQLYNHQYKNPGNVKVVTNSVQRKKR